MGGINSTEATLGAIATAGAGKVKKQKKALKGFTTADGQELQAYHAGGESERTAKPVKREPPRIARCPSPYWMDMVRAGRAIVPPRVDSPNCQWRECLSGKLRCGKVYPSAYVRAAGWLQGYCEDCVNEALYRRQQALDAQGIIPAPEPAPSTFTQVCEAAAVQGIESDPIPLEDGDIIAIRELGKLLLGMTDEQAAGYDPHVLMALCDAAALERQPDCLPSKSIE